MDALKDLKEQAGRCAKCGTCLLNCPLYPETLLEQNSSRGKLSLIESLAEGDIPFSKRLSQILSQCLVCNTCGEGCPNQVRTEEIFLRARKELCAKRSLPVPKKLIFRYILRSVRLLPALLKAGSLFQGFLFKKVPRGSGLRLRFPFPFIDSKRMIPELPKKFFKELYSENVSTQNEKMRVAYFFGCATNYVFPHVGAATINILQRHGASVFIPRGQVCCGLMAFGSGDWKSTREMARQNIRAFAGRDVDYIVTNCASCGAALKKYYPMLFEDCEEKVRREVEDFSSKIVDISELLTNRLQVLNKPTEGILKTGGNEAQNKMVTYHDPCHLHRSQGISVPPRQLLRSLPGHEFVEMELAGQCCGMGGSFNISYYDLSMKILDKKLKALEKSGANTLVTGCMGCMLQFMDGIHQKGLNVEVKHLTEMLDKQNV
jgi:glycolate oxidase iron-sulfur subunit